MDGSSSGGGNGHRVEAERWLSISEKLLSAPTIAVHSSKYGQQECFGIFLQLRDQVLPPNLDIYCAFFCDPASNMGSREVSLVMEGSPIRSAIASHYGMLYYTWSPMYLCLLLERTWSCLPLRNACFPLMLHPKMYSPMLSHWYSVWMWTTFSNFLLLCYTKGEFYFIPTSISLNLAEIIVV